MKTVEERMIDRIKDGDLEPTNLEEAFDEMLDECYSFESIGGPFACMTPSRVLREMDPIAHRCGVSEMSDDDRYEEFEGEFYDKEKLGELRDECQDEFDDEEAAREEDAEEARREQAEEDAKEAQRDEAKEFGGMDVPDSKY